MADDPRTTLLDPLVERNPVLYQMLGICPALAISTAMENALAMGLCTAAVLTISNLSVSLIRHLVPDNVRIIIYLVIATIKDNKRLRRIAADRVGDNICTFARAFDRRTVDPWTIRAAYDELQGYFGRIGRPFPIRASDRFKDDLKMDGDDLCDLLFAIAERSRHDITFLDANPQIHTIGELVTCISNLPKIEEAEQAAT